MIKFFRKIRQNLLSEGKTGTYLKYAIGEIFLVVVGILIALSINNWNEKKKEKNQSIFYHQQLINDLQIVINSLESDMFWAKKVKAEINTATAILGSGDANEADIKTIDFALGNYFRLNRQLPEITSYEEMKSSGQLYLIYNKTLRNDIADYLRIHYNTRNIFAELNAKVNDSKFLDPYVKFDENNTLRSNLYTYDFSELSVNKTVVNTLSRYAFHWEAKYSFAKILKDEAEELISKINEELSQLQ